PGRETRSRARRIRAVTRSSAEGWSRRPKGTKLREWRCRDRDERDGRDEHEERAAHDRGRYRWPDAGRAPSSRQRKPPCSDARPEDRKQSGKESERIEDGRRDDERAGDAKRHQERARVEKHSRQTDGDRDA